MVSGISALAVPTCGNGTWTQVTRDKLGDADFDLTTTNQSFMFNGFNLIGNALQGTATYLAIVISFEEAVATNAVTLNRIALCAGDIATRPAPKTADEVLRECERYYEMSYENGAAIDTATAVNAIAFPQNGTVGASSQLQPNGFDIFFSSVKRVNNPDILLYSPQNAATGGGVVNVRCIAAASTNEDIALSGNWTQTTGNKQVNYIPTQSNIGTARATTNVATPGIFTVRFHYTADARLGIVN